MVQIKRAYDPPTRRDGYRVLIDRLWPRGIKNEDLSLDAWAKELAPSGGLRRWFGHDPNRWKGFTGRYRKELQATRAREALSDLTRRAAKGTVTIVYGARDEQHNDAVVVRGEIERRLRTSTRGATRRVPPPRKQSRSVDRRHRHTA